MAKALRMVSSVTKLKLSHRVDSIDSITLVIDRKASVIIISRPG